MGPPDCCWDIIRVLPRNFEFNRTTVRWVGNTLGVLCRIFHVLPQEAVPSFHKQWQASKGMTSTWPLMTHVCCYTTFVSLLDLMLKETICCQLQVWYHFRRRFILATIFMGIIGTGLAVIHPAVNAFALMTLGIPSVGLLIHEVRR